MLAIPNTTTTANEADPGAAIFPATDSGALTPYVQGFVFVANASAALSVRRGETPPGQWSPYALVSPTLVPITTDRGGRKSPQYVFGVKAIDAVAGTHAQIFGALFQAGEVAFTPSAQFTGSITAGGGFTPPTTAGPLIQHGVVTIVAGVTQTVVFAPVFSGPPHVALGTRSPVGTVGDVPYLTTAPTVTQCTIGIPGAPTLDVDWIAVGPP